MTGGLFLALAVRIAEDVARTGRATGVLLLASELLVVVLTLVRRPAIDLDANSYSRVVTAVSIMGPALVIPDLDAAWLPDRVTAAVSAVGLLIVIGGKLSLGRSFGMLAANRGVVSRGFYRVVRHPIYAGYLITHAAFAVANAMWWNALALAAADAALLLRALREERILLRDSRYVTYAWRVRWRMVPGVF